MGLNFSKKTSFEANFIVAAWCARDVCHWKTGICHHHNGSNSLEEDFIIKLLPKMTEDSVYGSGAA